MSTEECKLCNQECTPWFYIHGHICQDCYLNSKENKWINVKEKLPDLCQEVLCYAISKDEKFYSIFQAKYFPKELNKDGFEWNPWAVKIFCEGDYYISLEKDRIQNPSEKDGHFYVGEVTHWMPLNTPSDVYHENKTPE